MRPPPRRRSHQARNARRAPRRAPGRTARRCSVGLRAGGWLLALAAAPGPGLCRAQIAKEVVAANAAAAVAARKPLAGSRLRIVASLASFIPDTQHASPFCSVTLPTLTGQRETGSGIACSRGAQDCNKPRSGPRDTTQVVQPGPADQQRLRKLVASTLLPRWLARCGPGCAQMWNTTRAPVVDIPAAP